MTLWLPVIAYMATIFGLSSLSRLPPPPGSLSYYHVHIAAYAGLAVLMVRAMARASLGNVTWRVLIGAIAISTLYGVSDEVHQRFVPGRDFDVLDMAADAVGAIAAAGAIGAWSIINGRFERRNVL